MPGVLVVRVGMPLVWLAMVVVVVMVVIRAWCRGVRVAVVVAVVRAASLVWVVMVVWAVARD